MRPRNQSISTSSPVPLEQTGIEECAFDHNRSLTRDIPPEIHEDEAAYEAIHRASAPESQDVFESAPDGGYGWIVVGSCFICMFFAVGNSYAWGVIQARLVSEQLGSSSSVAFIGALYAACPAIFAILLYKSIFRFGARAAHFTGMSLIGVSQIIAGWSGGNLAGLYLTVGLIQGIGSGLVILPVSLLSSQWFSTRRGLANGIIFSAGGIGGASIAMLSAWLLGHVGVDWTFRIIGIASIASGLPASFMVRERTTRRPVTFDTSLLSDHRFLKLIVASALNVFALFIAPFFLPMYGQALGLSAQAAAGLAAGYNLASAMGRLGFGFLADWFGPINSLILSVGLNSIALLLIWPFAESVISLAFFVALSGITSGAFFSLMPTVVTSLAQPHLLGTAMALTVSSWAPGYLVGAPIAGYLLDASGGSKAGINPFRPGMFYAGGLTLLSTLILLQTRSKMGRFDLKHKL